MRSSFYIPEQDMYVMIETGTGRTIAVHQCNDQFEKLMQFGKETKATIPEGMTEKGYHKNIRKKNQQEGKKFISKHSTVF